MHYGTIDNPEAGAAYEYHLNVHCGIRAARFGGRWWMTLVATDLARFEWDDGNADFTPAEAEPMPCA